MKKRALVELIIAVLLVVIEVVVVLICRFSDDALNAASMDVYMTSVIAIFINIDVIYAIALIIVNQWLNDKK